MTSCTMVWKLRRQQNGRRANAKVATITWLGMIALASLIPPSTWPALMDGTGTIRGVVTVGSRVDGVNMNEVVVSVEDIAGDFHHLVPEKHAVMDQRGLTFVPHILPILVGTTVDFPNSDPVFHNVFSISAPKRFNLGMYPTGVIKSITFDKPGRVDVLCNVHLEMHAIILVKPNPYFTTCDERGEFSIPDVPAGRHRVQAWHEAFEPVIQEVVVPARGTVRIHFSLTERLAQRGYARPQAEFAWIWRKERGTVHGDAHGDSSQSTKEVSL